MNPSPLAGQINRGSTQNDEQNERARFFRNMGNNAIPGEYILKVTYNGGTSASKLSITGDPRMPAPNIAVMKQNYKRADEIGSRVKLLNDEYQKFYNISSLITKVEELSKKNSALAGAIKDFHPKLKEKYEGIEQKLSSRPDGLFSKINGYRVLATATDTLKDFEEKNVANSLAALAEAEVLIKEFMGKDWPEYEKSLSDKQVSVEAVVK